MAAAQQSGKNPEKADPRPAELRVTDVVSVLNSARRILERLSQHAAFESAGIGLTEWAFLHALEGGELRRGGQIALRLGISPQRSAQVVSTLTQSGLITATTSADDSRKKELALTDKGRSVLKPIDDKMLEVFRTAYADRPNAVRNVRQNLVALGKSLKAEGQEDDGE